MARGDASRIRGVRYGAGSEAGMMYSNQVMDSHSSTVLFEALADAGHYDTREFETYREPLYLTSKAGIVQYYKDIYNDKLGAGGWKDRLAKDKADFDKSIGEHSLVASIKKSLNPERINQSGGRQGWDKFGKTLPPSAYIEKQRPRKRKRARVQFNIYFKISNSHKSVNQTVFLNDSQTLRLMEEGDFDAVLESYMLNNIDMLEELDIGAMSVDLVD